MEYFPKPFAIISEATLALKETSIKSLLKQMVSLPLPIIAELGRNLSLSYELLHSWEKNRLLSKYQHGVESNVQVDISVSDVFFV